MPRLRKATREHLSILLFLLASAIFLFADAKVPPIALPDEARNAINALEMHIRGFSLVTTFNFQPELWNTKPPLLIWLMAGSMDLFGPSELALRLPAALAGMGILCCTLLFVRRVTGSLATAIAAAAILLLSPGFFGEHGARTADFDGPLTFFVTAGLQLLFFTVHQARPGVRRMLAVGGLVATGALTKTIAAFIPVAGVLVYLVAVGRFGRVLSLWQRYAIAAVTAVTPLLIFYAAREAAGPGYLAAVIHNDILGRFNQALVEPTTPIYYVRELFPGWFVAGPFLIAAPLAWAGCSSREKLLFLYSASIAVTALAVLSAASSRAVQYALPTFPWLGIIAVLTLRYLGRFVVRAWRDRKAAEALVLGAALALACGQLTYRAATWRYERFPARQFYAQATYGDLFAALSAEGIRTVTVVDPGVIHLGRPGYTPMLRWNQLIWAEKGLKASHLYTMRAGLRGPLASCEPTVIRRWSGRGFQRIGSCALLRNA
ncbi:glycosyltransferase family 39 protein [Sphingomonas sp.]|uniref:ArnT family glycosyltransferase n=1 Tax=Sphingomonas sp. TaxID=28214 RepID=UPI0025F21B11|nr:glycosyltransferase family 39 protein [Sphingomonas sp.]MBV9529158.1 glycosyltransferase family 39 protein [Sphingomonas sp.]